MRPESSTAVPIPLKAKHFWLLQFSGEPFPSVNTSARFDPVYSQVNQLFGQVTGARPAAVVQVALSLRF